MSGKIGLLGGSFDPVHEGHVALARRALEDFGLDEVWFVPTARSPFKPGATHFTDEERVARLREAIASEPRFRVCLEDLERGGVSYTCELIERLIAAHPDCEFTFILGADSLASLHRWHRAEELVGLCRIVSYGRRGSEIKRDGLGFDPDVNAKLFADYRPDFDMPVSSTEIRAGLNRREPGRRP